MKKVGLFLSLFMVINSVSALNVIHKESEDGPVLIRLLDINSEPIVSSYNRILESEFYYYWLRIGNTSEDQAVEYKASGSIKDSIEKVKKIIDVKAQPLALGFIISSAFMYLGVAWPYSSYNREIAICAILGACLNGYCVCSLIEIKALNEIQDYLKVEKTLKESLQVGLMNQRSIIVVSDHELQTVEIEIQQKNDAYYEVTLTEIEN